MRVFGALGGAYVDLGDAQVDILHTNTQYLLGELSPLDVVCNSLKRGRPAYY